MNIDNSLGMTLFTGDISGSAAAGGQQAMSDSVSGSPEGSLFQQLISQMLMGKNQMAAKGANAGTGIGATGQSEENGSVISQMLFPGGNLIKGGLQNAGQGIGVSAETKDQNSKSAGDAGEAMEALQSLMAGLTGIVPAVSTDQTVSENQSVNAGKNSQIAAIGTASSGALLFGRNKQILAPEGFPADTTAAAGAQKAVKNGITAGQTAETVLTDEGQILDYEKSHHGNTAVFGSEKRSGETDLIHAAGNQPSDEGVQKALKDGEFKIAAADKMPVIGEGKPSAAADQAEHPKQELKADELAPNDLEFRNSAHAAAAAGEVPELNQTIQTVEAKEPYRQISDEILTKLEQKGATEFQMQLEPEDLGQIDIKLKLSEGKLMIDILAANSKTQALLASQVDKLISGMGLSNVQVESVQVNQQMNSQTQDNSQSQNFNMNSAMDFSQRKQQEQFQQQLGNGRLNGAIDLRQKEAQADIQGNRIETKQYDSHRMNLAV